MGFKWTEIIAKQFNEILSHLKINLKQHFRFIFMGNLIIIIIFV
jgi:hypothetical protein